MSSSLISRTICEIKLIYSAFSFPKSNCNIVAYFINVSNNIAERAVKPFVINRKVFMASGSYAVARYTTIMFSIIRTALINHLDIQKYLIYVTENINKLEINKLVPYYQLLPKGLKSS